MDVPRVSKYDWLHGVAPCPNCHLSLDPDRDGEKRLYSGLPMEWTGVEGTHRRCGARFVLELGRPAKT